MNPSINTSLTDSIFQQVQECGSLKIMNISTSSNWGDANYCALMHLIGRGKLIEHPYCSFDPESSVSVTSYYEE